MTDEKTGSLPLSVGSKAPGFSLPSRSGRRISLIDFAGTNEVLVYFYPKDDTPGCTKQACSLRDAWRELSAAGIVVLGISRDDAAAHNAFAAKYDLPFDLLTDSDHAVHDAYGAWGFTGPVRNAYLVDRAGFVRVIFKNIDTSRFAEDVLVAAGYKVTAPELTVYEDAKAAVAEAKTKVQEAFSDAKAAVAEAVPAVRKAAKTAVADFEKRPAVKKAVADVKAAAGKASASAKKAVANFEKKPAVKQAIGDVKAAAGKASASAKKAVANFEKKPAVKKAVKAVKSAIASLKKKAGKAAPKKKTAKKTATKPMKKAVGRAAPKKGARKVARPAPRAAKRPVKKAARGRKR